MSNLVLSIFLSSSNPSEEKQKNSSLFVLHSSLNLSQVLHQDFDLTAITELDDTLFANLANTLTGKVELATDFLQTLLVATDTIAVAQNLALTVFQYRVENAVTLARETVREMPLDSPPYKNGQRSVNTRRSAENPPRAW